MSYFSDLYGLVNYPIASEHSRGLRNAQIGAIHAIASHSTLEPVDAAVIVMPTGSGKTTVLMLAPYVLQKTKVVFALIATPVYIACQDLTLKESSQKNYLLARISIEVLILTPLLV